MILSVVKELQRSELDSIELTHTHTHTNHIKESHTHLEGEQAKDQMANEL